MMFLLQTTERGCIRKYRGCLSHFCPDIRDRQQQHCMSDLWHPCQCKRMESKSLTKVKQCKNVNVSIRLKWVLSFRVASTFIYCLCFGNSCSVGRMFLFKSNITPDADENDWGLIELLHLIFCKRRLPAVIDAKTSPNKGFPKCSYTKNGHSGQQPLGLDPNTPVLQ